MYIPDTFFFSHQSPKNLLFLSGTAGLSQSQQLMLKHMESVNLMKIKQKFSGLRLATKTRLEQSACLNVCDFKHLLIDLFSTVLDHTELKYLVDTVLYGCTSVADIFNNITEHQLWDHINPDILVYLVKHFAPDDDDDELKQLVEQYDNALGGFVIQCSIQEYLLKSSLLCSNCDIQELPEPELFAQLSIKINTPDILKESLNYVVELWESFSKRLQVPKPALILHGIANECLCVTWMIPGFLIPQITKEVGQCRPFFEQRQFSWVKLNNFQVYPFVDPKVTNVTRFVVMFDNIYACISSNFALKPPDCILLFQLF